jgi:hypothetical protein
VYAVNYWKRRSMHTESPMHGFLLFFYYIMICHAFMWDFLRNIKNITCIS